VAFSTLMPHSCTCVGVSCLYEQHCTLDALLATYSLMLENRAQCGPCKTVG
jgi:hypothetical protein